MLRVYLDPRHIAAVMRMAFSRSAATCPEAPSRGQSLPPKQAIAPGNANKDLSLVTDPPVNEPGACTSAWFGHGKVNASRAIQSTLKLGPGDSPKPGDTEKVQYPSSTAA